MRGGSRSATAPSRRCSRSGWVWHPASRARDGAEAAGASRASDGAGPHWSAEAALLDSAESRVRASSGLFVRSLRLRGESGSTAVSRFASGADEAPPLSTPVSTPLELLALVGSSRVREGLPRRDPRSRSGFPRFREPFAHPRRHEVLYAAYAASDAVDRSETSDLLKPRATAYGFQRRSPTGKINRNFRVDGVLFTLRIRRATRDDPRGISSISLHWIWLRTQQTPGGAGGTVLRSPVTRTGRVNRRDELVDR